IRVTSCYSRLGGDGMKQVFGPIRGFRVLQGPAGAPERLELQIDASGLDHVWMDGFRRKRKSYPLDQVAATAENGALVLQLGSDRYVLEAKRPERFVQQIEAFRDKAAKRQRALEARNRRCTVCQRRGAPVTCVECGEPACERH